MGKIVTRSVKYEYTDDEKQTLGADLARAHQKRESQIDQKKVVNKQLNSQITEIESLISDLASKLDSGFTFIEVKCEEIKDYTKGVVCYVRTDTGEAIEERAMTFIERQTNLDEVEPIQD